jgi:hypothetical protein
MVLQDGDNLNQSIDVLVEWNRALQGSPLDGDSNRT